MKTAAGEYIARATQYVPTETKAFASEMALLATLARAAGRVPPKLVLFDSAGELLTSMQFAGHLERLRDTGVQHLLLAIGPPDGWSDLVRKEAHLLLSFGRVTLPHELAHLVLAEQIYRALAILAGHPYHTSH